MSATVRKILITGVESSGKSTLAAALASHYSTLWVPEFAREYLLELDREYIKSDLVEIAKGQVAAEREYLKKANRYLFCDTGMLVLKIWSEYKFGHCDPFILNQLEERKYDLYILCSPHGIDWEYDPLREAPDATERAQLHKIYQNELRQLEINYLEVTGTITNRKQQVIQKLHELRQIA